MAPPISTRSGKPSSAGSPSIVPRLAGWASWGDYDRRQLEQEWRQHGLTSQLSEVPHVNLKQRFGEVRQLPRPVGLNAALQLAGMSFQGQQHRALEDARNTARLLPLVLPVEH
ncbi:exonuclease [Pseudomonas aeruginosa]|nr:exonuclease [Pseudomonas aeruginosa]